MCPRTVGRSVLVKPALVAMITLSAISFTAFASHDRTVEARYDALNENGWLALPLNSFDESCDAPNIACFALETGETQARFTLVDDFDPRPVAAIVAFQRTASETIWNVAICSGATLPIPADRILLKVYVPRTLGLADLDVCEDDVPVYDHFVAIPITGIVRVTLT